MRSDTTSTSTALPLSSSTPSAPATDAAGRSVKIVTAFSEYALELAARLEAQGYGPITVDSSPVSSFTLFRRRSIPLPEVSELLRHLGERVRPSISDKDDASADIEIHLGDTAPASAWNVQLHVDSQELADRLKDRFEVLGFRVLAVNVSRQSETSVQYGGLGKAAQLALQAAFAGEGISPAFRKEWGDDDRDVWIHIQDPALASLPPRQCRSVQIVTDDLALGQQLVERLERLGFQKLRLVAMEEPHQFSTDPAILRRSRREGPGGDAATLVEALKTFLKDCGVDRTRFPLKVSNTPSIEATIELPFAAMRSGALRPYAGPIQERARVIVHDNDSNRATSMMEDLRTNGFQAVSTAPSENVPRSCVLIRGAFDASVVGERMLDILRRGVGDEVPIMCVEADGPQCEIDFFIAGRATDGTKDFLPGIEDFQVQLTHPADVKPEPYLAAMRDAGVLVSRTRPRPSTETQVIIRHGGAPVHLMLGVAASLQSVITSPVRLQKSWSDDDHDVFVQIPTTKSARENPQPSPAATVTGVSLAHWLAPVELVPAKPLVEKLGRGKVRVGELELTPRKGRRDSRAPATDALDRLCLDPVTAETLVHVAQSVVLAEPCMLEGETCTSKTSSISALASLLGQPLVRINLNGQTDTAELLGRYVPASTTKGGWVWKDGLVVEAIRKGWWLLLDEVNLAEPQVLERLNSLLEQPPTLVLSEHEGEVFGGSGTAIHPELRLFATMNPADYAGRSTLSPAYRDRWRGYRYIRAAGERELLAMLQHRVTGAQPDAVVLGCAYVSAKPAQPTTGWRAQLAARLEALARFHVSVVRACQTQDPQHRLGANRREPYVFTRRTLLSLLEHIEKNADAGMPEGRAVRLALHRYYVERVEPGHDREVMTWLLQASGLAQGPTALPTAPTPRTAHAESEGESSTPAEGDEAPDLDLDRMLAELSS